MLGSESERRSEPAKWNVNFQDWRGGDWEINFLGKFHVAQWVKDPVLLQRGFDPQLRNFQHAVGVQPKLFFLRGQPAVCLAVTVG